MARPARDFEGMFEQFVTSSLSRAEFLRLKGINPQSGSAYRGTHDWDARRLTQVLRAVEPEDCLKPTAKEAVYQMAAKLGDSPTPDITINLAAQLATHLRGNLNSAIENRTLSLQDIAKLTDVLSHLQTIQRRSVYRDNKTNSSQKNSCGGVPPVVPEAASL